MKKIFFVIPFFLFIVIGIEPSQSLARITKDPIIYFDFNKSNFNTDAYDALNETVSILLAHPSISRLKVEGHADPKEKHKTSLSKKRTEAVIQYLVNMKVKRERLIPIVYGATRPVASSATAEERAKNQRVEFNANE